MSFFKRWKRLWTVEETDSMKEEAKKRIYDLHLKEAVLFYIDDVYQEAQEKAVTIIGEQVRGKFARRDICKFLDCEGLPMREGKVLAIMEEDAAQRGLFHSAPRTILKIKMLEGNIEEIRTAQMLIKN